MSEGLTSGANAEPARDVGGAETASGQADAGTVAVPDDPTTLGQTLLETIRAGGDPAPYLARLGALGDADLRVLRENREAALAFWLNCYNAGTQLLLDRRPDLYESRLRFLRFFSVPCLTVAGTDLGLDDIEQGILRGRSKYGLGYLPRLLPTTFEMRYRLDALDPRIHFALNCGAESCPAIRSYAPDRVDDQLDLATRTYLDATVGYDPDADTVRVPRVFLWYRGDFGGKHGTVRFLRRYDAIPADASPTVRYRSWDWSRLPGKFVE